MNKLYIAKLSKNISSEINKFSKYFYHLGLYIDEDFKVIANNEDKSIEIVMIRDNVSKSQLIINNLEDLNDNEKKKLIENAVIDLYSSFFIDDDYFDREDIFYRVKFINAISFVYDFFRKQKLKIEIFIKDIKSDSYINNSISLFIKDNPKFPRNNSFDLQILFLPMKTYGFYKEQKYFCYIFPENKELTEQNLKEVLKKLGKNQGDKQEILSLKQDNTATFGAVITTQPVNQHSKTSTENLN